MKNTLRLIAESIRERTCPALIEHGTHRIVTVTVKARAANWPRERDVTTTRCITCGTH